MNKKIKLARKPSNTTNIPLYKPKIMTQSDMKHGLSNATEKIRQQRMIPQQPVNIGQRQEPQEPQQYGSPRFGKPQIPNYWGASQQQPPQQQYDDSEPYWTAEEWESWAYQLYHQYPETQKFLPEWFLEAVQAEQG